MAEIHQIRTTVPYTILIFKVLKSRITRKKEERFFKGETIFFMTLKVILIEPDEKISREGYSQNLSHPIYLSEVSDTI